MVHPQLNLSSLGIVINTRYKAVVCISCAHAITTHDLHLHVNKHFPFVSVSPDFEQTLREEFGVSDGTPPLPRDCPPPVFGIAVEAEPFYFCSQCSKGYRTLAVLKSHQRSTERCPPGPNHDHTYTRGYAQTFFFGGTRHSFFQVNADLLPHRQYNDTQAYQTALIDSLPPPDDYDNLPLVAPQDNLDLGNLMHRERCLDHLEGLKPLDIQDMVRLTVKEDGTLHHLGDHTREYLASITMAIEKHASFGVPRLFAKIGE